MKRRMITILVVLVLALLITSVALALVQYNMLAWTAEGSGGRTKASTYILTGSIGQPDAGKLTGGVYSLTGGILGTGDSGP
jgi:hypothetical protein